MVIKDLWVCDGLCDLKMKESCALYTIKCIYLVSTMHVGYIKQHTLFHSFQLNFFYTIVYNFCKNNSNDKILFGSRIWFDMISQLSSLGKNSKQIIYYVQLSSEIFITIFLFFQLPTPSSQPLTEIFLYLMHKIFKSPNSFWRRKTMIHEIEYVWEPFSI